MKHRAKRRSLGRSNSHRRAMVRNLARSLVLHEKIQTTDSRARVVRPQLEKLITLAKRGDLHARRLAFARLQDKEAVHKLFEDLADRFADRPGGYTRVYKLGMRSGDAASMVQLELV